MALQTIIDYIVVTSVWHNPNTSKNDIEEDLECRVMSYIKQGYVLHGPINYVHNEDNVDRYCSQVVIKYGDAPPPAYQ